MTGVCINVKTVNREEEVKNIYNKYRVEEDINGNFYLYECEIPLRIYPSLDLAVQEIVSNVERETELKMGVPIKIYKVEPLVPIEIKEEFNEE